MFSLKKLVFIVLIYFGSVGVVGAERIILDTIGCEGKRDLWVVVYQHDVPTANTFINSGLCKTFREGQKVKVIGSSVYMDIPMIQVKTGGRNLWVIRDFVK